MSEFAVVDSYMMCHVAERSVSFLWEGGWEW